MVLMDTRVKSLSLVTQPRDSSVIVLLLVFRETAKDHVTAGFSRKRLSLYREVILFPCFVRYSSSLLGEERFSWKIREGKQEIMLAS